MAVDIEIKCCCNTTRLDDRYGDASIVRCGAASYVRVGSIVEDVDSGDKPDVWMVEGACIEDVLEFAGY